MPKPMWRTRDGEEIAVEAMTDIHIKRAYGLLISKRFIGPSTLNFYLTTPGPQGEHAKDAFEHEFNDVIKRPVSKFVDLFEEEMKKRKIKF